MNTNELTRLTTSDLMKAKVVTDSLIISKEFKKQHSKVLKSIRDLMFQIDEISQAENGLPNNYFVNEMYYIDRGKEYPCYEMNFDFYMLLVMSFTGKKALKVKTQFINSFNFMAHELTARHETRFIGKTVRNDLTKSISENIPACNFKNFAHSNYTRLIYKKVLGMQVNKWKEIQGLQKKDKPRDFFNKEQLEQVQIYESKIADIIEFNTNEDPKVLYKKIQAFLNNKGVNK